MSIVEAVKGIWLDVSQNMPTTRSKIQGITRYAKILGAEVAGIVSMVPYACSSWWLYSQGLDTTHQIHVKKDCRYGGKERNVMDIYMPSVDGDIGSNVVLFVHGGVWATGAKWHYAPLATRLAQEGILTCVIQYSLYPSCLTDTMVGEVSQALDWVLDEYSDQKKNIFLVGHSAGAHLCAMSLLERSKNKKDMPDCFVGMAGVYDIEQHYEYERSRHVHHLSTMKRAIGGHGKFPVNSPTIVLKKSMHGQLRRPCNNPILHGEKIPSRVGLVQCRTIDETRYEDDTNDEAYKHVPVLDPEHLARLPKTYLMASCADVTVPWTESSEYHSMLHACGVQDSNLLLYHRIGHGDFVVDWTPRRGHMDEVTKPLPEFAQDFLHIVKNGP
jgi:acetyl esterase/lipase